MFNLYVWKYHPYLLETFSNLELAQKTLAEIVKINPDQKAWIEGVVCRDSVEHAIAKYNSL